MAKMNMKKLMSNINKLCTPAYFYLVLSVVAMVVLLFDNINNFTNNDQYCVGNYKCSVPNTILVFGMKALYIAFWTFALNCLCKSGYTNIAWFLVLLPYIMFFVIFGFLMLKHGVMVNM